MSLQIFWREKDLIEETTKVTVASNKKPTRKHYQVRSTIVDLMIQKHKKLEKNICLLNLKTLKTVRANKYIKNCL